MAWDCSITVRRRCGGGRSPRRSVCSAPDWPALAEPGAVCNRGRKGAGRLCLPAPFWTVTLNRVSNPLAALSSRRRNGANAEHGAKLAGVPRRDLLDALRARGAMQRPDEARSSDETDDLAERLEQRRAGSGRSAAPAPHYATRRHALQVVYMGASCRNRWYTSSARSMRRARCDWSPLLNPGPISAKTNRLPAACRV